MEKGQVKLDKKTQHDKIPLHEENSETMQYIQGLSRYILIGVISNIITIILLLIVLFKNIFTDNKSYILIILSIVILGLITFVKPYKKAMFKLINKLNIL